MPKHEKHAKKKISTGNFRPNKTTRQNRQCDDNCDKFDHFKSIHALPLLNASYKIALSEP
jgi:hypothetical protein